MLLRCTRRAVGPHPRRLLVAARSRRVTTAQTKKTILASASSASAHADDAAPQLSAQTRADAAQSSNDTKDDDKDGSSLAAAWAALPQEHRAGLGVVTAATAALNFSFGAIVPLLPQYALGLGLGSSGVGLVLAAPAFARVCLNSPFGRLADSRGRRPLMIFGEAAAACGVALTGAAPTATTMVAARLLVGAGGSAANAGSTAYVGDVTGLPKVQRHRGLILGVQSAATAGAWVLGPACGGVLAGLWGAPGSFAAMGGLAMACAGGYYALVPETLSLATKADEPSSSSSSLLHEPAQRTCLALNAVLHANYAAILAIMPLRCADVWVTAGPLEIGALFSAVSAVGVFGGPLAGKMADRHRRAPVVCAGLGLAALGGGGLALADAVEPFTAAFFAWGFGVSVAGPALTALTNDVAPPSRRGESLALSRTAADGALCVAPVALGLLADLAGSTAAPFAVCSLATAGAVGFLGTRASDLPSNVKS